MSLDVAPRRPQLLVGIPKLPDRSLKTTTSCSTIRNAAFTLLELLIVISILALLSGLLLVGGSMARTAWRFATTAHRIDDVLARLARSGQQEGSTCLAMQRAVPLPGVVRFGHDPSTLAVKPLEGAWLAYDQPWELRFPWGRGAWGFDAKGNTVPGYPQTFALSQMTPRFTAELLVATGVAPDAAELRTNRSTKAPWNDAWGNVLVLGIALFQYGPDTGTTWPPADPAYSEQSASLVDTRFTRQWELAKQQYQTMRTLTVCIAALGPQVDGAYADPAAAATALADAGTAGAVWDDWWQQVNATCNRNAAGKDLWRVEYPPSPMPPNPPTGLFTLPEPAPGTWINAQDNPPWKGLRRAKAGDRECVLSAPQELP